jgi:hypothetical protein
MLNNRLALAQRYGRIAAAKSSRNMAIVKRLSTHRICAMSEDALLEFVKAARFMCKMKDPPETFKVQLNEAQEEWKRGRPKGR